MPSQDDLASTIDELARKLDDVPAEKIREELQRYVDHGVPLHQAKKDIENALSSQGSASSATPSEPQDRTVEQITTDDQNVNLTVKVLSVDEREITARGEEKTIWSGMLGDETGTVAYTAWRDVGLEENAVVRLENAYVTEWQDAPQINIGDHATVEPTDANMEVPDAPPTGGKVGIGELVDGMRSVDVTGRVLSKSAREVTVQGEPTTLWEGEIADATGRIPYTAWHDFDFKPNDVVRIRNAYVRSFRGLPQLNFGENADLTDEPDDAVPEREDLEDVEGPEMATTEREIQELSPGMSSVEVTGRVLDRSSRRIETDGNTRTLWEGEIADATGRIPYTAWHDFDFDTDDVIRIRNAYVRSFRGLPQLNFGENADLTDEPDDAVPPIEEVDRTRRIGIADLQAAEGAVGVRVDGVVIEIREGSGLILRCPECRRVLVEGACRMHGDVDGVPDLRVKAVVDDGTGAITSILDRSMTETVLEKSLDECQTEAEEAQDVDVIEGQVKEVLLMKRVTLEGNATHDDYGTTFLVNDLTVREPEELEETAEELIETVDALAQEVPA